MTRILVTGAGGSAGSNFCDALRLDHTAHHIVGSDVRPYHLELMDLKQRYLVPRATDPGYAEAINAIVDRERIEVVHPQPDIEVAWYSAHRERIGASTFLPGSQTVDLCQDKLRLNGRLAGCAVPVPLAFHITGRRALRRAMPDLRSIHPKVWLRAIHGAGSLASLPIANAHQGYAWIEYWQTKAGIGYGDFMASEFLPGPDFAWQSLWHAGELVTSQARERVEYLFGSLTPSGQTSSPSVARTVNREDVNRAAEAAVRAVVADPHGIFCVDLKEGVDGVVKVTEINAGRFFTTSNFFAHAGLNMPAIYVELAATGRLSGTPPRRYNPLPADLYWVRMVDMGFKLVRGDAWAAARVDRQR